MPFTREWIGVKSRTSEVDRWGQPLSCPPSPWSFLHPEIPSSPPHPPQQRPSLALHSFQGRVIPREMRVQNRSGLGLSGLEKGSPHGKKGPVAGRATQTDCPTLACRGPAHASGEQLPASSHVALRGSLPLLSSAVGQVWIRGTQTPSSSSRLRMSCF